MEHEQIGNIFKLLPDKALIENAKSKKGGKKAKICLPVAPFVNADRQKVDEPVILKTSKVISVYKKDSEVKYSNYRPISLLSNIDKALERLMYNCLYNFLEMNSVVYDL